MKNKRFIAVFLSVAMVLSVCMPMNGLSAYAAENAEVLSEEVFGEEEEFVSPEIDEEDAEQGEAVNRELQEDSDGVEAIIGDEIPAEPNVTEETENFQEAEPDSEAVEESAEEASEEDTSVEAETGDSEQKDPAALEDEDEATALKEIEEPTEIVEPEQLEEDREAAEAGSTGGNVAQAIYTDGNKTFTFYYGPLVSVGELFKGNKVSNVWSGKQVTDTGNEDPAWDVAYNGPVEDATSVVFDKSFLAVKPTSLHGWLFPCFSMTSLDLSGLDTSQVTDMSWFLGGDLTSVDLRGLDTSKVTTMANMFSACHNLTSINMAGLNTSNVTDMHGMFSYCSSLGLLDVTGIDTSKVTDMSEMFRFCIGMGTIRMNDFNSSNVTDMNYMFDYCEHMTSIDMRGLDTSKVTDMSGMFSNCYSLVNVDLSEFNTSKATDMNCMFYDCNSLKSVDVSRFDTSKVTDMSYMFMYCVNLKTIYCSDSSTAWKSTSSDGGMFGACESLVGQDGSTKVVYNEEKVGSSMAKAASLGGYFTPKSEADVKLGKTTRGDMFNLANNVKVTWKEVPGAKYYKVYREGITNPKETQTEPVIVTSGLVGWDKSPGLTNGNAYRYKIVASLTGKGDPSGDSPLSYSKVMYRLKTVVIRSVKNTAPGKVTVKYDKTTSGDSYVLQYSENEDMTGAKTKVVLGANNTSYTIGGLKKGKTYYISIRVRKKVNGIDYYTTFGVPKKIKVTQ